MKTRLLFLFVTLLAMSGSLYAQQPVPINSGILTLNLFPGNVSFKVIVNQTVTSTAFLNPTPGTTVTVIFTENATGGYGVTFGGNISGPCTVTTTANATTVCQFTYDSSANTWFGASSSGSGGSGTATGCSFTGGLVSCSGSVTLASTVAGTSGGVPYFSGATTWASSGAMAAGQFMLGGGAGNPPTTSFSTVPVGNGGTGAATFTIHGVLLGQTTAAIAATAAGAADSIFMGNDAGTGSDPAFKAGPSGGTNGCAGTTDTPTYNTATHAWGCHQITGGSGTVTGCSFTGGLISCSGSTTVASTVAGTSGGVPYFSSASTWASSGAMGAGQFMLGGGAGSTPTTSFSVVPVANGGTGLATQTANVIYKGNTTSAEAVSSITDNGTTVALTEPLTTTGSVSAGSSPPVSCGTGTGCLVMGEAAATGITPTVGEDYIRADSATHTFKQSLNGAAETALGGGTGTVTGCSFTGGLISCSGSTTVASTVAGTSGGVPYFSGATTWASSGAMAAGQFMLGGGAGSAPTTSFSVVPVANGGTALASGTSGGILGYTATGTLASSVALTVNVLPKGGGAGATPTNSLITDNGTSATYTGTGGYVAPIFTSNATGAGFYAYAQGADSCVANQPATSVCWEAPAAVTSYRGLLPGVSATGITTNNVASAVDTQGYSGDANHSAVVTIGSGTSVGSTSLCSTANCPVGTYVVNTYVDITTACGTSGTYVVNLIYTDDQGSKTIPVNINGTGAVPATGTLTTTSTANYGENAQVIRSTGAASINYSTTAVACGTAGPMVGKLYLSVVPVQ